MVQMSFDMLIPGYLWRFVCNSLTAYDLYWMELVFFATRDPNITALDL